LAEYLNSQGYASHMVGKWHLGHSKYDYLPIARGFQTFFGYLTDQINYFTKEYTYPIDGNYYKDFVYIFF
jgi:arylsulfatase B